MLAPIGVVIHLSKIDVGNQPLQESPGHLSALGSYILLLDLHRDPDLLVFISYVLLPVFHPKTI